MISLHPISQRIITVSLILGTFLIQSITGQPCSQQNISLHSQSNVDNFKNYNCTIIEGQLFINGADITNLDSLIGLVEVGSLNVNSTNIQDFEGLNSLKKIHGGAAISFNPLLTSMSGLDNLEEAESFFISNNTALSSLVGLNKVRKLTDQLWISSNPSLLSLYGLNGLDSVRGQVNIEENVSLQNLTGLDNLISAGEVRIQQNTTLFSLEGLGNLSSVPGGVVIFLNLGL